MDSNKKILAAIGDLNTAENLRQAADKKYYSAKTRLESLLLSPAAPRGPSGKEIAAAAEATAKYLSRRRNKRA